MSDRTELLGPEREIREKLVHTMLTHSPAPYMADTLIKEARILADFILGREPRPDTQDRDGTL